jgi:NAD(P)H-dependent nitrite reductase small subunit
MQWVRIAAAADVPPQQSRFVQVGDLTIAIFHVLDQFFAIDDRCPKGGCSLTDGILVGTTVTCPAHHWRVCLKTGLVTKPVVEGTPQVRTYPLKVEDGMIFIGLKTEQAAA